MESGRKERAYTLKNMMEEQTVFTDSLHLKGIGTPSHCTARKCMGSIMVDGFPNKHPKLKNQTMSEAKQFIKEYYDSSPGSDVMPYEDRLKEVTESIENTGSYQLTNSELMFGSRTAWRNASRCVGRIQWSNLALFDARHVTTAKEMFDFLMKHLEYATNGGNIRSAITVFPQRTFGTKENDFRIWNSLLVGYAGYKQPNGDVIGDPKSVPLTEICQKLGWKGKGGMFDVLPLVLQADGNDPELFEIPEHLVLQVSITHPKYPRLAELGLKWIAVPGVANMCFDCGGLEFTGCQFSGWYMSSEIVRDLTDLARYNMLKPIAERMGIPIGGNATLWKDKALVELTAAVLHSYQKSGVTLTDHHSASESFMTHLANEQKLRGGCPADWVWVVPPISSSLTQVFHQEMLNYKLRPSYEYMDDPWKTFAWQDENLNNIFGVKSKKNTKKMFQSLVKSSIISRKLMVDPMSKRKKCLIIYASETGRSAMFAEQVQAMFKKVFNSKVVCMSKCRLEDLTQQQLVICVTSTFGNGDPPGNAKIFYKELETTVEMGKQNQNGRVLDQIFYSVFALGSRAYPKFCEFGHAMSRILKSLGGTEIEKIGQGDELQGQEEPFKDWLSEVFKAICREFVLDKTARGEIMTSLGGTQVPLAQEQMRLVEEKATSSLVHILSKVHSKDVKTCTVKARKILQKQVSDRETIMIQLEGYSDMSYSPGDHAAIFASNDSTLVNLVLSRLQGCEDVDTVYRLEVQDQSGEFFPKQRLPACTIRQAFTHLLDLKTPPSQCLIKLLVQYADDKDKKKLLQLTEDSMLYQSWSMEHWYSFGDLLSQFPSLRPPVQILLLHMPILPARYYSISSSLAKHPGEIHLTVGVYNFTTEDGCLHKGLCSNYLKDISMNDQVSLFIREESDFHLPSDHEKPVIMIGPGTGIAPFRSFWQQREMDAINGKKVGPMYLYFGCRSPHDGNFYAEETSQLRHIITRERRAFSRESQSKKLYAQNLVFEDSELVKGLLRQGAHIYVCGGIKMAGDVQRTLKQLIHEENTNMSSSEAKEAVAKLKRDGYYHEDIYGVNLKLASFIRQTSVPL